VFVKGNVMKRALSVAVVLAVAMIGRGDDKKPVRDAMPRAGAVEWDLQTLEDSPAFAVVKREVKGNTVTWVLENKRNLGAEIIFGYQAAFLDADGVKLFTVGFEVDPFLMNMAKGERNRFVLNLPRAETWKDARKVVIKNGQYTN
jgi:hypothetical protein